MTDPINFNSIRELTPVMDLKFALSNFVGQQAIKIDLEAKITRAKQRDDILPHLLFCGPDEIGKKTLAKCIAHEMGVNMRVGDGSVIERPGDLGALVTNCDERDLLVIPHCDSLNKIVLEVLIPVFERFQIDIMVGQGPAARSILLPLRRFTLVCTTSKPSQVDKRLRRWMVPYDFTAYAQSELVEIVLRLAADDGWNIETGAAELLAGFAAGSPGEAKVLLKEGLWPCWLWKYGYKHSDCQRSPCVSGLSR